MKEWFVHEFKVNHELTYAVSMCLKMIKSNTLD